MEINCQIHAQLSPPYRFDESHSIALPKNERAILRTFLLSYLYKLFRELFRKKIRSNHPKKDMEYYLMDKVILQQLLQGIVESDEYTLEGIANYTRIPIDVIYDIACGLNHKSSVAIGAKLADLYLQVNPAAKLALLNKLIAFQRKSRETLSYLLKEEC